MYYYPDLRRIFIMRINFRPQKLANSLALEEKVHQGFRRVLEIDTPKRKTIDMVLMPKSYSSEYYVSSYNVYDANSKLLKSMQRNNDQTVISKRNPDGKYSTKTLNK